VLPVEVADDGAAVSGGEPVDLVLANGRSIRARASMSDAQWIRLIRIAEAA